MGKRRSPGEKRLRGLLSGDPERVARTLRRSVWTNNPEIYATISQSKDDVIAAIAAMDLPDADAEDRRDRLFARFSGAGGSPECACLTTGPSGNPKSQSRFTVTHEHSHAGHSEMAVICRCGRSYRVIEDVGYHIPQYSWR